MRKLIVLLGIMALVNLTQGQGLTDTINSRRLFKKCLIKEWVFVSNDAYCSYPFNQTILRKFHGNWYFEYQREDCDKQNGKFDLVFAHKRLIMISFSYKLNKEFIIAALDPISNKVFTRDTTGTKTIPGYSGKFSEAGDDLAKIFWRENKYFLQGLLGSRKIRRQDSPPHFE